MSIAMNTSNETYLVSSISTVFKTDCKYLLPAYLFLFFSRTEFDRYARYKSHGSVREIFGWDEMEMIELPVPNIKKQQEIEHYIQSVIKKAKNGEITKELLEKARKENFGKNAFNWGIGFAISAAFLSTFIPKIQYWITRKATGSNAFPGTADYSNEKK